MNINSLVWGSYLLIPITLTCNGLIINSKDILFNTGAGVHTFVKKNIIKNL